MLQVLYKLKTAKVFERARGKEEKPNTDIVDEDPFAIQTLFWCPESRMLCVAGVSAHVIIYRFSKQEVTTEVVQVAALELHLLSLLDISGFLQLEILKISHFFYLITDLKILVI